MDSISQRLKELSRADFEKLCFYLVKERHPTANVRHVEGASGDWGADTFAGDLADGPTIWQSKAFSNAVGKSQRQQIRLSLRRAIKQLTPKRWVLCIPIDMDIASHLWFQSLQKSFAPLIIGLMQGSDITSELMHRNTLRDYFFPNASLNVRELRALITKTGEYSNDQLAALTTENAEQYIERLKDRDARFNYQLVVSTEPVPTPTPSASGPMYSITSGSLSIHAYPRDLEALRLNPPKVQLRFRQDALDKIASFVTTGKRQTFGSGEVELLHSDFALHEPGILETVVIGPRAVAKPIPARLIFGSATNNVVYDYIRFNIDRVGSEEVELTSSGRLPFIISVITRRTEGTFNISEHLTGIRLTEVRKWLRAVIALNETREITIIHLELQRPLFRALLRSEAIQLNCEPWLTNFINDGATVAEAFDPDLTMPAVITNQDRDTLTRFKELLDGRVNSINEITGAMSKEAGKEEQFEQMCNGQAKPALRLANPGLSLLFGSKPIHSGPFTLELDEVALCEPDRLLAEYRALPIGSTLEVKFKPVTVPRVVLERMQGTDKLSPNS